MVRNRDDRLIIEFAWPGDAQSQSREMTAAPDCESRAQAAAVVIASWLGILPEASLHSPPLGIPFAETRYAELSPPKNIGELDSQSSPHPAVAVPRRDAEDQPRFWAGVGLGAATGGGVVPGLRAELSRELNETGVAWSWLASTFVNWPRTQSRSGGTSHWIRPELGFAGVACWRGQRIQLGLDLGPLAGLTVAWGSDYPVNQTDESLTWGWSVGLRLQLGSALTRSWIELRAIDWLRAQSLQQTARPSDRVDSVSLPSWETQLTLGWSLATFDGHGW